MDCNNYSYAPYMLPDENTTILNYENDDMYITIDADKTAAGIDIYLFYACDYAGYFEVSEKFFNIDTATELFNHIRDNYAHSIPDIDALNAYIDELKEADTDPRVEY